MDFVENMQDFNIPSIDQDVSTAVEEISRVVSDSIVGPSEENKAETPPEAQETDNEALSSLLMLSKSNTEPGSKSLGGEVGQSFLIKFSDTLIDKQFEYFILFFRYLRKQTPAK